MTKIPNFSIVASFVGLWLNSFFGTQAQLFIGFLLIFSFGILHGANDLVLLDKTNALFKGQNTYKLLLYYIGCVVLGALLFYALPFVALLLFIVVSGYHFGEQHWHGTLDADAAKFKTLFHLSYGLSILSLLFIFHESEVQRIIFDISKITIPTHVFSLFCYSSLSSFILLFIFNYTVVKKAKRNALQELFFLIVFALIFKSSSLIWGFTIYFILWHSIPSLLDQIYFLYGSVSLENGKKYFNTAFYYWIISLLGILLLYVFFKNQHYFDAIFFSFLAAITFPHVWVIIQLFKTKKANS